MSSSLPSWRGKLSPLQRSLEDDNNSSAPFEVVYVSPCQVKVSNDPLNFETIVEIPCNVTRYECPDSNATNPSTLFVDFDYEVHYVVGADFNQTIQALEGSMLQHLAAFVGLENCPWSPSRNPQLQRRLEDRRLQQVFFTPEEKALFVSVSSYAPDVKDPDFDDCIVPVELLTSIPTVCRPMTGSMTAQLDIDLGMNPSIEESVRDGVLRLVRQGAIDDVYVTGNLKKVSFVGTRVGPVVNPNTNLGTSEDNDTGLSTIGVVFISVGCVLFILLVALLAFRRRRQKLIEETLFVDAPEPPLEPFGEDDPEDWHKRVRFGVRASGIDGSDVPGSLAAMDTLALKPSPTHDRKRTYDIETESSSPDSRPSNSATPKRARPDIDEADLPKTPEVRVYDEDSYVTPKITRKVPPTMDQDSGGDAVSADMIMTDLMTETDVIEDDDEEGTATRLVRIG